MPSLFYFLWVFWWAGWGWFGAIPIVPWLSSNSAQELGGTGVDSVQGKTTGLLSYDP